jgi:hypothetical protein
LRLLLTAYASRSWISVALLSRTSLLSLLMVVEIGKHSKETAPDSKIKI